MEVAVVSASEGAVKTLLGKLGSLLAEEAQLLHGVRGELQYIKDELESMNAFLLRLAVMRDQNVQVKTWMKQVREMAYDTEDCIDEFRHHLGVPCGDGLMGFLRKMKRLVRTLKARHRIAVQVQELKTRARDVSERHGRYNAAHAALGASNSQSAYTIMNTYSLPHDPRLGIGFIEEDQLVGINKRRERLLNHLKNNVQERRVISIFGLGGLGKTTLAKTTYHSLKGGQFNCQASITISQKFDMKVLLRDILRQLIPSKYHEQHDSERVKPGRVTEDDPLKGFEEWDREMLTKQVQSYLADKRYLVVLDDIWSITAWDDLKFSLPRNNLGSVIIVTTRIQSVAKYCCSLPHDYTYEIEHLDETEAEELFFRRVFGQGNNCPDNLVDISEKILKKCGGMPLAINNIAGLLGSRPSWNPDEWTNLYNSLGSELDTSPIMERVKDILLLSYNDLPYHLKTCFLYFSIYPENHKIRRSNIVRRWVAEGFVSEKRGQSAEQVGESYFAEFINRSIIQPVDRSSRGKVKTCRVHDVMLEVIVSLSVEENFVSVLGGQYVIISHDKVRRLSIHDHDVKDLSTGMDLSHLRSLTSFGDKLELLDFGQARLLRVLDLEHCEVLRDSHLQQICSLFQLKFLSLRGARDIYVLPKKIGKLKKLEYLDLRGTNISELPASFVELQHLVHLVGRSLRLPLGFGEMKSIRTLPNLYIGDESSWMIQEIGCLTQLKKLAITFDLSTREGWESILSALEKLSRCLRSLSLSCPSRARDGLTLDFSSSPPLLLQTLRLFGGLKVLPGCIASLDNLVELILDETFLEDDAIQVFQKLPSLLYLRLLYNAFVGRNFIVLASGFPNLELLEIFRCSSLITLFFAEGSMQKLQKLQLTLEGEENKLKSVEGMRYLHSLRKVEINAERTDSMEALLGDLTEEATTLPHHVVFCGRIYAKTPEITGETSGSRNPTLKEDMISTAIQAPLGCPLWRWPYGVFT